MKFYVGRKWNPATGRVGRAQYFDLGSHCTLLGPTGCGKGASLEIVNLLGDNLCDCNVVAIDITGQNRAVTHAYRSKFSDCYDLTPFELHGVKDARCNPLLSVGRVPVVPETRNQAGEVQTAVNFDAAAMIGQCLHPVPHDAREPLWPESAADFVGGLCGFECHEADAQGRAPTLENVFGMLSGDYTAAAKRMVATGLYELASVAARFCNDNRTNQGIIAHGVSKLRWIRSAALRRSMSAGKGKGLDWEQLKRGPRPLTVYLTLDADKMTFAPWLGLMVTSALNTLYRLGESTGRTTVFMLSEMAALGKLDAVLAGLGQGRKYGIRFAPMVWQDKGQIPDIYGKNGATRITGNSGCLFAFAPEAGDDETADYLSKIGGQHWVKSVSASDDPQGGPPRITVNEHLEPVWPVDRVRTLPAWHGLVWRGKGKDRQFGDAKPVPVYCPPYWEIRKLARRASPDPYHPSAAPGRGLVGKLTRAAAVAAAVIAGGAWLAHATGHLPSWPPAHVSPSGRVRVDPPQDNPPARGSLHHHRRHMARR